VNAFTMLRVARSSLLDVHFLVSLATRYHAVGIEKPDECDPQSQDDQCSTDNHSITPRSITGDACHARSIAQRSASSVRFFGRGKGAPAGDKPSGLFTGLQETSMAPRAWRPARCPKHKMMRCPDHGAYLGSRSTKSSGTGCRSITEEALRS